MFHAILILVLGILLLGALMWLVDRAPFIVGDAKTIVHWILLVVMVIFAVWCIAAMLGLTDIPIGGPLSRK